MTWSDWAVLGILAAVYVGTWAAFLAEKYRYIRDCPVPVRSRPWMECFECPHADDCGRASSVSREWGNLYRRMHSKPKGDDAQDRQ